MPFVELQDMGDGVFKIGHQFPVIVAAKVGFKNGAFKTQFSTWIRCFGNRSFCPFETTQRRETD